MTGPQADPNKNDPGGSADAAWLGLPGAARDWLRLKAALQEVRA